MKRTIILLLILFIQNTNILAQNKRDYKWIFGTHKMDMIDFNRKGKIDTFRTSILMGSTNVSISDKDGDLLFFSNGCKILDSTYQTMENGDSINYGKTWESMCAVGGPYPNMQNAIILPDPGNDFGYYMVHKRQELKHEPYLEIYTPELYYSYIDMRGNGGRGKVIEKDMTIFRTSDIVSGYLSACRHANGEDWWLVQMEQDTNIYFKILLTKDTIMVQDSQSMGPKFTISSGYGPAKFTPDGSKWLMFNDYDHLLIYDFDRESGELSNLRQVDPRDSAFFSGLAISPNSRFAYISAKWDLYQVDLSSEDVEESLVHIAHWDGPDSDGCSSTFAGAQLAPDCKIYIVPPGTTCHLHVINKPNLKGKACDFQQSAISLSSRGWGNSLPNFPHFRIDEDQICDSTITWMPEVFYTSGQMEVNIYPNPASEKFSLSFSSPVTEELWYNIYDMQGGRVQSGQIPILVRDVDIDLKFQNSTVGGKGAQILNIGGIYLVQIRDSKGRIKWSGKLVVE